MPAPENDPPPAEPAEIVKASEADMMPINESAADKEFIELLKKSTLNDPITPYDRETDQPWATQDIVSPTLAKHNPHRTVHSPPAGPKNKAGGFQVRGAGEAHKE